MSRRRSKGRDLNGLLLLDKSSGESSNRALQKVKALFNANKAGHTGTLDPLATGLLIICFGRATKISDFLLNADKQYRVTFKLGIKTSSGDIDGEVLEQCDTSSITQEQIEQAAAKLTGDIEQTPPMISALKYQGKRLYELARKGIVVDRNPRNVTIHNFELIDQQHDHVTMHVTCSKGTYVRTLVEDLGEILACGAHVTALRRTALGPFIAPVMYKIDEIEQLAKKGGCSLDKVLLPTEEAIKEYPAVSIDEAMMLDIEHGRPIQIVELSMHEKVRIYDEEMQFYGVASLNEQGKTAVKRLN